MAEVIRWRRNRNPGEDYVANELRKLPADYQVFWSWVIPGKRGADESEIDFILVSPGGVFAIECKYWRGKIRGDINIPKWTQTTPEGDVKEPDNPLHQLSPKIFNLKDLLTEAFGNTRSFYVKGIIVLAHKETTLETPLQTGLHDATALMLDELAPYIEKYNAQRVGRRDALTKDDYRIIQSALERPSEVLQRQAAPMPAARTTMSPAPPLPPQPSAPAAKPVFARPAPVTIAADVPRLSPVGQRRSPLRWILVGAIALALIVVAGVWGIRSLGGLSVAQLPTATSLRAPASPNVATPTRIAAATSAITPTRVPPTLPPPTTTLAPVTARVSANTISVRDRADTSATELGRLQKNEQVTLIAQIKGQVVSGKDLWYLVRGAKYSGWIPANGLEISGDPTRLPFIGKP